MLIKGAGQIIRRRGNATQLDDLLISFFLSFSLF